MANQKCSFAIKNNILIGKKVGCEGLNNLNIGKLILNTLKSEPDHIGQVHAETGREITFKEIRNRSVKLAKWMKVEGIYSGDLVGICTNHHVGMYAFLACLYIGAIPIIRKYDHTNHDIAYDFMRINPKIIFIDKTEVTISHIDNNETADMLKAPSVIVLDSSQFMCNKFCFTYNFLAARIDKYHNEIEIDNFTCTELNNFRLQTAMIIYTRGTDGLTKTVRISHEAIMAPVNQEVIAMLPGTVGMWLGPSYLFPNLILAIHSILAYKRTIIFEGDDMKQLWRAVEKYKVNWVRLETNLCKAVLDSKDLLMSDISSLKMLMFSGSRMKHCIYVNLNTLLSETSIVSLYGMTETGIIAFQRHSGKPGSSGYVGRNISLMITDASGTPFNSNKPGKIWCKCWGMSNRYYNINDTASIQMINEDGWCDTGDIGYYDDDGDIYVIGRARDFIHFKEFYFSPTIIENIINEQPGVNKVAVVAKPNDTNGEIPVAFITEKTGKKVNEQEIIDITNQLWDCMQLRGGIILLDKMPYGSDGNIDRNCLRRKVEFDKNTSTSQ